MYYDNLKIRGGEKRRQNAHQYDIWLRKFASRAPIYIIKLKQNQNPTEITFICNGFRGHCEKKIQIQNLGRDGYQEENASFTSSYDIYVLCDCEE